MSIIGARMHAGDLGLEGALELAVKCDTSVMPPMSKPIGARSQPPGRSLSTRRRRAEDRVLALEQLRRREPARRHHEHQPHGFFCRCLR
jgi:hypothetical protein